MSLELSLCQICPQGAGSGDPFCRLHPAWQEYGFEAHDGLAVQAASVRLSRGLHRLAFSFVLMAAAETTSAGGSLAMSKLDALLAQQPNVRAALLSSVRLSHVAFAEVRFGSHFVHLGGERAGPYTIDAVTSDGKRRVQVVLCTSYRLLDAAGTPVAEDRVETAAAMDERLQSVIIREVSDASPQCP